MAETVQLVEANGIEIEVGMVGSGPDVLLVHGFPHTRALWTAITPVLARSHRVIALDLRGTGGSTRAADGYDAGTLAADLEALLDTLGVAAAQVVAIDAGVPPAFLLAVLHPDRVRQLVLMESTLGRLPGAEDFYRAGPPWWFGFHQVPGLAETVLAGHEDAYLDFFYRSGTHDGAGIDPAVRDAFVAAYSGTDSLRCAFEVYRAMAQSAQQIADASAQRRLTVPTMAIGARPVGEALHRQLMPVSDDVRGELIADCGHIIPLDRPSALIALLADFL